MKINKLTKEIVVRLMIRKLRIKCCAINFKDVLRILEITDTSIDLSCTVIQFIKIKFNICKFVPEVNGLSFQYEVELCIFINII